MSNWSRALALQSRCGTSHRKLATFHPVPEASAPPISGPASYTSGSSLNNSVVSRGAITPSSNGKGIMCTIGEPPMVSAVASQTGAGIGVELAKCRGHRPPSTNGLSQWDVAPIKEGRLPLLVRRKIGRPHTAIYSAKRVRRRWASSWSRSKGERVRCIEGCGCGEILSPVRRRRRL